MRKQCKNLLSFLMALALLVSLAAPVAASSATASVIRLSKTTGTVQVSKNEEEPTAPVSNMQLYSGHHVITAEKSNAWLNMDSKKLLKEDSLSEVEVRKDGKKLEAHLLSGNLYFNVSKPLESDEDLQIRTSTMVVGIRGTSGWVCAKDRWTSLLGVLEGTVECSVTDPVSGQTKTAEVHGGQKAECRVYPQDHAGDKCEIIISDYSIKDIPGFALSELVRNISLCDKIRASSGRNILAELANIAGGESSGRTPCGQYASDNVAAYVSRLCEETADSLRNEIKAQKKQPNTISKSKILGSGMTAQAPAAAGTGYSDVPNGAWYADAVAFCRNKGIMGGASEDRFQPDQPLTRSQLAVILYRIAGSPETADASGFADVADVWYAAAVRWVSGQGLMTGYKSGNFGPSDNVTREQLAVTFWRYAGSPEARKSSFDDASSIHGFAVTAVDWAVENGLMRAQTGNRFAPAANATRADVAVAIAGYMGGGNTTDGHSARSDGASAMNVVGRPCGVALTKDGSLLVTDVYNKVIWKVDGDDTVQFAGKIAPEDVRGEPIGGYHDSTLAESLFKKPWDIEYFLGGWAISDTDNNVVRFLRTGGAGGEGTGVTDLGVSFEGPTGLAVDDGGNLYVAETDGGRVRMFNAEGKSVTVASDLEKPTGLCWANGSLYIAESGMNRILKVNGNREITVVAGDGSIGSTDGAADHASFAGPKGVAVAGDGTIYVADTENGAIRQIKNGQVSTVLKHDPADVTSTYPASPTGLEINGSILYVTDAFAGKLLMVPIQ